MSLLALWRSFKGRLILTVGALAFAWSVIAGVYFIYVTSGELARYGGDNLRAMGTSMAIMLSNEIRERSLEIDLLRRSPMFIEGNFQDKRIREALDMRKGAHPEYMWIGVADMNGKVLQSTDGVLLGSDVSKRPWFAVGQSGTYVGDVHEAVLLSKHLPQMKPDEPLRFIDFAAPIVDVNGQSRAVLAAHASWDWVNDNVVTKVKGSVEHRNVEIFITNGQGDILYPYKSVGVVKLPSQSVMYTSGVDMLDWPDEGQYLTSIVPVEEVGENRLNWHVVLREPISDAYQSIRGLRTRLVSVALLFLVAFIFMLHRIAVTTSRPIEELAKAAKHVFLSDEKPKFPDPNEAGSQEMSELCVSFQAMTTSLLERETELEKLNISLEAEVQKRTSELMHANQRLENLATTDGLTGLKNRRSFDERLSEEYALFQRSKRIFSILMIDVDYFKLVNDNEGHQVGDEVLRLIAKVLKANARDTDIVARYGGEEFVILLPDSMLGIEGLKVAEKIRAAVEATDFPFVHKVTVSVGVSWALPDDAEAGTVVQRADHAVYQAKSGGRNRVEVKST